MEVMFGGEIVVSDEMAGILEQLRKWLDEHVAPIHQFEVLVEALKARNIALIGTMLDVTKCEVLEIAVRNDGKVVWVNTEKGCIFRACQISKLILDDRRDTLTKVSQTGVEK
jgi:hypothetical protein